MDAISDTLSNTAISTVFSKKNLGEYLQTYNLRRKEITEFTITDYFTKIGEAAFFDCTNLKSINIPDNVTKIGQGAFASSGLENINITAGVTEIGEEAFNGCFSLTSIIIPNSVTMIGSWAFAHCTNLKSITIPASVTEIDRKAFAYCTNLAVIICNNPGQFDWDNIGVNLTRTQIISYSSLKPEIINEPNNDEAYLIYRLISELEFNPSWAVLETTFNERSLPQIKRLLQNIDKNTEHLPIQMIFFRGVKIPTYIEEFLSIADRSSLFGQAQRTIDIRPREQEPAAQQQAPSTQLAN